MDIVNKKNEDIIFSIIIPTYNSSGFIYKCLDSLNRQNFPHDKFEVVVVDDASSDDTIKKVKKYNKLNLKLIELTENGGPGTARNHGIDASNGEWLLFIDSDDIVTEDYLSSLNSYIVHNDKNLMAVGFDWARDSAKHNESRKDFYTGRRDGKFLFDKNTLIDNFLSARMDGSVIYTAMRKDLIKKHNIYFAGGLHEDIDFIYKIYQFAEKTGYLNKILYLKSHREESIINTVSQKHIEGYIRAWREIGKTLKDAISSGLLSEKFLESYSLGLIGMVASRVKEIRRHSSNREQIIKLYEFLYDHSLKLISIDKIKNITSTCKTSYCQITKEFMDIMSKRDMSLAKRVEAVLDYVSSMEGKSWSCTDLHYSVFLRPNEVNTCCRRFFVNNQRKGDVTILSVEKDPEQIISSYDILNAKKELHHQINTGIENPCDGCPFLEYKEWDAINSLDIRYLSFEYHSVCNLRCSYCSDEYYGGSQPSYNIMGTIDAFLEEGSLDNCHTVVWGGGEPTIDKNFDGILEQISNKIPNARHRLVTNGIKRSEIVEKLLSENKLQLTTSIDSGSEKTFELVRGRNNLKDVIGNLIEYSSINPNLVTIKYLFTEGNGTIEDLENFADLIEKNELQNCLFQISMDFKYEHLDIDFTKNMIILYGLLKKINCKTVYFDEIVLQRIRDIKFVKELNVDEICRYVGLDFIAKPSEYPKIVIWGASGNSKSLLEKSIFFKDFEIEFFVDSDVKKHTKKFCGKDVKPPEVLKNTDYNILITAVQGYGEILKALEKMDYPLEYVIDKLII
ncbi:glycosyltransferase [Sulfurimonas sp. HSL-1716]|uniref:glycosyltransferase n=1 Tax=Hydrocurvibacter sulfurireducens TaxID=3131937 RepID=UPI0031F9CEEE